MSNKLHLSASRSRSKYHWTPYHLTTMNFGRPNVQFSRFLYPTDDLNVRCSSFFRTQPMVYPAYIRAHHRMVSAFVPAYQVDEYAEYVFTGTQQVGAIKPKTINFNPNYLTECLSSLTYSTENQDPTGSPQNNHFCYKANSSVPVRYYTLNAAGKIVYKVFKDLGYEIYSSKSVGDKGDAFTSFNAYPLLCYLKLLNDYYLPQQYKATRRLTSYLEDIKHRRANVFTQVLGEQSSTLTQETFNILCQEIYNATTMFNSDYFTTAWSQPNMPTPGSNSQLPSDLPYVSTYDETIDKGYIRKDGDYTYDNVGISDQGSARSVQYLLAFDKWLRRNNFIGQSTSKKVLTMFGINPEQTKTHDADIIRSDSYPLEIGDVTSFAGTENTKLGQYAGKAFSKGDFKFKYHADDYGMLFVVSHVDCDPLYLEGVQRDNLAYEAEDYYQKEYDGLQAVPVYQREIVCSLVGRKPTDNTPYNGVFGFQPNYEWLRSHRDSVSGDMALVQTYYPWYALKQFEGADLRAQNTKVLQYPNNPYSKLFAVEGEDFDKFICNFQFDINITRPIMSSSQATGLEQGDIDVEKFGN